MLFKKIFGIKGEKFFKNRRLGIADFSRYDLMRSSTRLNDKNKEHELNLKILGA